MLVCHAVLVLQQPSVSKPKFRLWQTTREYTYTSIPPEQKHMKQITKRCPAGGCPPAACTVGPVRVRRAHPAYACARGFRQIWVTYYSPNKALALEVLAVWVGEEAGDGIRRGVILCTGACAVLIFIINVPHSHTELSLWIRHGVVRCSGASVVLIFIINVPLPCTELPLWIRHGLVRCSGACAVFNFIIHVAHSHTEEPLLIRHGVARCSGACMVLIFIINVPHSHADLGNPAMLKITSHVENKHHAIKNHIYRQNPPTRPHVGWTIFAFVRNSLFKNTVVAHVKIPMCF
jgi:hypothetical protein